MTKARKKLLLIDGSHALFRAFHAIRTMRGPDGRPTNAVFGWTSMLLKLLQTHEPDYVAACFDASSGGFRAEIDPNYKANRSETPPELLEQWPVALRVTRELGVMMLDDERLEADDIIATLATVASDAGVNVLISSGDKDLMALVTDDAGSGAWVRQIDEKKGQTTWYDEAAVREKWGVRPDQVADLLAIMGDSVDNIPGVKGIGKKGAVKLLVEWDSFDGIYANIDEVQTARTQRLLRESEAEAQLARQLVALVCDAELGVGVEDLSRAEPDRGALTETFKQLGFKRLLRQFHAPTEQVRIEAETVTDLRRLRDVVTALRGEGELAVDVFTTTRDPERHLPMRGQLIGVGLAGVRSGAFYIPIDRGERGTTADLFADRVEIGVTLASFQELVGPLLADASVRKVGHDLKYTSIVLQRAGVTLHGRALDTLLGAYLLSAGKSRPGLAHLALDWLGCKTAAYEEVFGAGRDKVQPADAPAQSVGRWMGERAAVPVRIASRLRADLEAAGLRALHDDIELPLTAILADVEQRGMCVDVQELHRQSASLGERCEQLQQSIWARAGGPFNVGSPKQLGEVLFEKLGLPTGRKTRTGYSTNQATLEGLRDKHPIIDEIFTWRQLSKLKSTYTDALPALVHPETGRVHTSFNQAVAATGRLSSTDPNLQNIPIRTAEGRKIRRAFTAPPGHVLLSADYSQIELRVMAHLADEPTMQAAFRDGLDIHQQTAAEIFKVALHEVSVEQRGAAKTINFGVLYGMGSTRLAASIGVSRKEAKAFIAQYFERFSRIKEWVDHTLSNARETCEVRTMFGRRRVVDDILSSNHMVKAGAERIAVNTPVQGSAADIIKLAMIDVQHRITAEGLGAKLLLQVHDELLLEVPQSEAEQSLALVVDAMSNAAALSVPLKVQARFAANWAEAH